jgi:hypothetical protein
MSRIVILTLIYHPRKPVYVKHRMNENGVSREGCPEKCHFFQIRVLPFA